MDNPADQFSTEHLMATSETQSVDAQPDSKDNHPINVTTKTIDGNTLPNRNSSTTENGCSGEDNSSLESLNLHLTESNPVDDETLVTDSEILPS